jgi:hypothetical protein
MEKTVICHFYNEEFLLPWWLKHHKHIFDHGIMINYHSTDCSVDIIREICPHWEIRYSRNKEFHAERIDLEVMDYEQNIQGWRMALNVPEFLYGNTDHLDHEQHAPQDVEHPENLHFHIGNYVFVDMEDTAKHPAHIYHDQPLHDRRYWGYVESNYEGWQSPHGSTRRLSRSIHNYPRKYPEFGRHFPQVKPDFDDLVIFYYGWADISEQGVKRKLQIKDKIDLKEFAGCHHDKTKEQMFWQYRVDQQPNAVDLRETMRPILEHNHRITGQHF